jgi:mediator of RNA polymerase II transcription subunit 12
LVVLGSIGVPDKTKDQIALFFRDLATIPEFKTAAFRHLALLKDAFLSSNWGKADPAVETGMIETLKAIMSEGPPSKGSIPSLNTGVRLSAWRWTSVVLEMRVEIKRLVARIDESGIRDTLRKLLQDSVHRDITADDADLLCETFRSIDPIVIPEILATGLDRLAALLARLMEEDTEQDADKQIDLVLRIICSSGADMTISENGVLAARYRLLEVIIASLQASEANEIDGQLLRSSLKLLRFVLNLNVVESQMITAARPDYAKLIVALLRISTVS